MEEEFSRTVGLIGALRQKKLNAASVIVFGCGGVGSYAVEAVARAGVGSITVVDNDTVSLSDINRQLIALHSTVGKSKTSVIKERILDINPNCNVTEINVFYSPETPIELSKYDFVIDCIDSVLSKVFLISEAKKAGTPIISVMGTGNKLHPEMFEIGDISETSYCPLARAVRQRLKKEGIEHLTVVYSKEIPVTRGETPASIAFVPSSAGLLAASFVIGELIK